VLGWPTFKSNKWPKKRRNKWKDRRERKKERERERERENLVGMLITIVLKLIADSGRI
jgi:hypothetical protein